MLANANKAQCFTCEFVILNWIGEQLDLEEQSIIEWQHPKPRCFLRTGRLCSQEMDLQFLWHNQHQHPFHHCRWREYHLWMNWRLSLSFARCVAVTYFLPFSYFFCAKRAKVFLNSSVWPSKAITTHIDIIKCWRLPPDSKNWTFEESK